MGGGGCCRLSEQHSVLCQGKAMSIYVYYYISELAMELGDISER